MKNLPEPLILRAIDVGRCTVFQTGQQVVVRGRHLSVSLSEACCVHLIAQLQPLLLALERGLSEDQIGVRLQGGIFRCAHEGCKARFELRRGVPPKPARLPDPRPDAAPAPGADARPFLQRLDHALARRLTDASQTETYYAGDPVLLQGERNSALYLIQKGRVRIVKENEDGTEIRLAELGPGECFGEMSLLANEPCNASVRAATDCAVWRLDAKSLDRLMGENPALHRSFSQIFARRLGDTNVRLSEELARGITGKLSMISLAEIVQALCLSQRSGTLAVSRRGGERGTLLFSKGRILSALMGELAGPPAFHAMAAWPEGSFCFSPEMEDLPPNIRTDPMTLLMESARLLDESLRDVSGQEPA